MTAVPDRSRALFALAAVLIALAALVAVEAADLARAVDSAVLDALVAHRGPRWTEAATTVTNTGASPFAYPVALVTAAVVGLRTGRWRAAVAAPVVLVLGVLSRLLLSIVVRDERPPAALHLVPVSGFSFPSGHASSSALLAGALIWLMAQTGLRRPVRLALSTILALWALAVAVSRIYLGVHWVSDIAGSWLLAAAWLTLLPLLAPRPSVDGGRPPARLREPGGPDPGEAAQDGERHEPDGRRDHRSGTDG